MVPAAVTDSVFARCAVLGSFEECGVVVFAWRVGSGEVKWDGVFGGKRAGEGFVDGFALEGAPPKGDHSLFFALRIVGDRGIGFDDANIDCLSSEGRPEFEESGDLGGAAAFGRLRVGAVGSVSAGGRRVVLRGLLFVEILGLDLLGDQVEGGGVAKRDPVVTVYVEAFAYGGVVSFDQLGEGGVVVSNGPCSLERQLEFDFNCIWVLLEGLLDGPLRCFVECRIE